MDKNNKDNVIIKKCCLICRFFEDNDISDDRICWLHTLKSNELEKEGKPYDNIPYISNVDNKFIMNCDGWFELNEELK